MKFYVGMRLLSVSVAMFLVDCSEQTVDASKTVVEIGRPSSIQIRFVAQSRLLRSNI